MSNESLNVFGGQQQGGNLQSVTAAMAMTRQAQEVQAAMVVAKTFPRNQGESMNRILEACTRPTLAENATYTYNRGGTEIVGPSIRLAECIAQNWGNIDFGFMELERKAAESTVQAYAWDLETNTRRSLLFSVKHKRDTKNGSYAITEDRDIYELIANQAQRRVRACILALIPGDVIDAAMSQCDATLKAQNKGENVQETVSKIIAAFAEFDITADQIRGYIGKNIEAFNEKDVVHLRRVYTSLKDGIVGNDYFLNRMKESGTQPQATEQATAQQPAAIQEPAPAQAPAADQKTRRKAGQQMGLDDL